jgi:hypothetical protein
MEIDRPERLMEKWRRGEGGTWGSGEVETLEGTIIVKKLTRLNDLLGNHVSIHY